ncbi:MAG: biopolymer transporter Tol [Gemmataceae bacterium]|nr:biopolymer transporter Tol [Gemmataceae bacterium]
MWTLCVCLFLAQPGDDWQKLEAVHLKNTRQVTRDFVRAGEGYFSPDASKIIFQAEEKGENPFYQMFVMNMETGAARRVSPGIGKTTCGYFHPSTKKILFASSHLDPDARKHYDAELKARAEEKETKNRRRYAWDFDKYMEIFEANLDGSGLKRLTNSMGYDGEGSYSADGKKIVFCSNRSGAKNLELYTMDADGKNVRPLTKAPGCYNGGPFFSPDGKKVIFRSDRKKKDHLQLYVINVDGTNEKALTDDESWVFWAPYWYKDSTHIIYTAADHSNPLVRPNYDLYWMNIETGKKVRLTFAPGADVLPVFSPDYAKVMWTSNRDGRSPTHLYLADFIAPK